MCRRTLLKDVMGLHTDRTFITHLVFHIARNEKIGVKIASEASGEVSPAFFSGYANFLTHYLFSL